MKKKRKTYKPKKPTKQQIKFSLNLVPPKEKPEFPLGEFPTGNEYKGTSNQ